MPITYEIDSTRNLIRTTCFGHVRLPDVMAHFDALQRDPNRPDRLDVLLDLRGMTTPPEAPQLQAVADRVSLVEGLVFGACAIVTNKESMFGMARMFEVLARAHFAAIRSFRDVAEAEEWLETF
jgi:stage II sporulation SpoAA-like protein